MTKRTLLSGTLEKRYAAYHEKLKQFSLMDDTFMTVVFEDIVCAQLLLRIILDRDDLTVTEVRTQRELRNVSGKTVVLDIFAEDESGRLYDVEVQRSDTGGSAKRARFNSGALDAAALDGGESYDALRETYVIFITENDVLRGGLPIYHIERVITETGALFNDGEHIIYVNSKIRDTDTPLGRLMYDFHSADPDDMYYGELQERTRYYKGSTEGGKNMCRIVEELAEQFAADIFAEAREAKAEAKEAKEKAAAAEAAATARATARAEAKAKKQTMKSAVSMLKDGIPAKKVAKYTRLTIKEVQDLMEQVV